MWHIALPTCTAIEAYRMCRSSIRDQDLKSRLEQVEPEIGSADDIYRQAGADGTLDGLHVSQFDLSNVTVREMSWLYDRKMVPHRSAARSLYNTIRGAARNGRCPLCGHRQVMTLDHYLPKAHHAALTVNPANLIPSCTDCNKAKLDAVVSSLHPYFDNVEQDRWLYASVERVVPAAVDFFVKAPASWPYKLVHRVHRHFKLFDLRALYAAQAAHVLSDIRLRLINLHTKGGAASVQFYLEEEAKSRKDHRLNSWQTALYEAMAESSWYCDTGFKLE
ncbi:HNH endonuclease [Nonomuraea sp. MTCD27]|uniref:HNH endonuclease n=1 Tax=Nonomuraea sp. MTCD27 TaxID=1676747 RepID=UPI0035C06F2E